MWQPWTVCNKYSFHGGLYSRSKLFLVVSSFYGQKLITFLFFKGADSVIFTASTICDFLLQSNVEAKCLTKERGQQRCVLSVYVLFLCFISESIFDLRHILIIHQSPLFCVEWNQIWQVSRWIRVLHQPHYGTGDHSSDMSVSRSWWSLIEGIWTSLVVKMFHLSSERHLQFWNERSLKTKAVQAHLISAL